MMTLAEVFAAAEDAIEDRGWTQHTAIDSYGQVCLEGALYCGVGVTPFVRYVFGEKSWHFPWPSSSDARTEMFSVATDFLMDWTDGVAFRWNDADHRTKEEVLEMLREARLAAKELDL